MATGLREVLEHLHQSGGNLTDGQLLARFVAARDEASFAALVRRHGPMVLGVCRRVLHDFHHAEDAFQATFLVLARKAASVVKRESVGCWLYGVAYRTALEAGSVLARRRAKERPMRDMPHPQVAPAEAQDWRPLLDRELSRLPDKYQAAVVLCDLEGRPRREAARQLGIPEGTLSSRLAVARKMLARRLAGSGIALSAGALAAALTAGTASAGLPAALVWSTARAAALVAAGQMAAVSTPAALLMKEVMKAMLLKKLRMVIGAVMVLAALGTVGIAYQAAVGAGAARAAPPDKPVSELDALRKENELLKLNLQIVLEKVRAQEAELQTTRKQVAARNEAAKVYPTADLVVPHWQWNTLQQRFNANLTPYAIDQRLLVQPNQWLPINPATVYPNYNIDIYNPPAAGPVLTRNAVADAARDAESAIKALREAKDKPGQRRAADALEKAMKKLREQLK
jgi:RNA polymerase sigma factor (sigma-70 family)